MRPSSIFCALVLVGCAGSGDEPMFILNNSAPTGTTCALTSDPMQPFLSHGSVEVGHSYLLTPLIESRITDPMNDPQTRTIHLQGANIVLSAVDASGNLVQVSKFTSLFSGSIAPLGAVNVAFEVLPASIAATAGEYSANISVFGELGGGRVDATPFDYAITVCNGCVIRNLATLPTCPLASMGATGNPCNPFQDGPVDCCKDASNATVCPGTTM